MSRPPTLLLLTFARQGEETAIRQALESLAREYPGGRWAAVGTPASAPVVRGLGVEEVLTFGEGLSACQLIRRARAHRPQAVVVIYSGPGFRAHLKLELLALAAGPGRVYRSLAGGPARPTARCTFVVSVAAKLLWAAVCAAAGLAICGIAFCYLRFSQLLAGGPRARRT